MVKNTYVKNSIEYLSKYIYSGDMGARAAFTFRPCWNSSALRTAFCPLEIILDVTL